MSHELRFSQVIGYPIFENDRMNAVKRKGARSGLQEPSSQYVPLSMETAPHATAAVERLTLVS